MRFPACALPFLLLASCYPTRPAPPVPERVKPVATPPALLVVAPPATPAAPTRVIVREISGIKFEGVAFDARNHRMIVVDQANGPGSKFPDAAAAAGSRHGIAAVNAGFFTPEGNPLGLVVAAGKISGSWNSASSLGSGVWYENAAGNSAIIRREKLGRPSASIMRELMQAGPLLVENGRPIGGLEATKTSARTFILWDGGTRWWVGRSSPCTLAALGNAVGNGQIANWNARTALNLDGGRSADLWVSPQVPDGPLTRRSPWNRAVRNFLVLIPR